MQAVVVEEFGRRPRLHEVSEPVCPPHGAVVEVGATGVCRSDWHGWRGHDPSMTVPYVPGHEFAGAVIEVGPDVVGWRPGDRVTAPFVNACGSCALCREGRPQVCLRQTQPGFTRDGSFAERVLVDHADVNLVALPAGLDDVTAAVLGCRFATAYRAVVSQARVGAQDWVLVLGCGGVGLSAVMVAASRGARVIAVDPSPAARAAATTMGAQVTLDPAAVDVRGAARDLTGEGAHASIDALGRAALLADGVASLRPGGRHVQVGLLTGPDADPPVDMGDVVYRELEILGSHGMPAPEYAPMLADIVSGRLDPSALIGRRIRLDEVPDALAAMDRDVPSTPGTTVAVL